MSNLLAHADREFATIIANMRDAANIDLDEGDVGMQEHMHQNVREILEVIATQGHSGGSIGFLLSMVQKLGMFEPLSPIRGTADEWVDVGHMSDGQDIWQNNRCGHVFRDGNSQAYDSTGRIVVCSDGCTVTNFQSRVPVEFPYVPKRVYAPHDEDRAHFEKAGIEIGDYATAEEVRDLYSALTIANPEFAAAVQKEADDREADRAARVQARSQHASLISSPDISEN